MKPQVGIYISYLSIDYMIDSSMLFCVDLKLYLSYDVVKKAVTELKSKLSKNKILVSVAAGIKLNDLQVLHHLYSYTFAI